MRLHRSEPYQIERTFDLFAVTGQLDMTTVFPLIACAPDAIDTHVVAYRKGVVITAREFLRDIHTLAKNLPPAKHYLNICADRYHITLLLMAVMLRDARSLLPPNTTAETLQQLKQQFSDICVLVDHHDSGFENAAFLPELLGVTNDRADNCPTSIPHFPAEQIAAVLFTSGSTGYHVPNQRTWGALCQGVRAESQVLGLSALGGGAPVVILGTVPAQHSYGLESTVMLPMQTGQAFSTDHSFYPADVALSLARMPRPRVLVTTPFHLRLLLESKERFPEIDLIISATAPLSPLLAQGAEQQFRTIVCEIYGCTEAGPVATRRTTSSDLWTLFPHVELSNRGSETWVGGGHVGDARRLHDEIEICGDNTFRLFGRTGDMINIVGKRTSLAHLNFHLNSIAGVDDGLFMAPQECSDGISARLTAFVVSRSLTAERILASLRDRIDPAFLPRPLHMVDSLPRNATGKIIAQDIRQLIASRSTFVSGRKCKIEILHSYLSNHKATEGHFVGCPIIPGVTILVDVVQAIRANWSSLTANEKPMNRGGYKLRQAKFLRPVVPGEDMTISLTPTDGTPDKPQMVITFECTVSGTIAAKGIFEFHG